MEELQNGAKTLPKGQRGEQGAREMQVGGRKWGGGGNIGLTSPADLLRMALFDEI